MGEIVDIRCGYIKGYFQEFLALVDSSATCSGVQPCIAAISSVPGSIGNPAECICPDIPLE